MIKCPNCTGELKFSPKDKEVVCEYCGSKFNPKELKAKVKAAGESKTKKEKTEQQDKQEKNETYEGQSYTCSQCGATLMTFDETAITFCSYCGSQAMIESKMMKVNKPDFIIPFEKTKEDCIQAYKNKISKSLFVPNYLKSDVILEKFRGIYIPYAIYKLEHNGPITNKGSKYSHRSGDYVYYDDYTVTSHLDASYEGLSYDLISKFYDKFSTAIPYNFQKKEDFNLNYLTGYYADAGDVDSTIYDSDVESTVSIDISKRLRKYSEFSKYGCSPTANIKVSERKVGMFPVYFLAIRNKDNKTINYAVVNGQSGEVAADLPISFPKYIVGSLILFCIIFALINSFIILTPIKVTVFSTVVSTISLITSIVQASKIKKHENHTDDKGYTSKNIQNDKKDNTHIFKYLIKEILAVIVLILVIIFQPVNDAYYYGASLIALGLVILSFYDLVKEHNILVSNKLPQLEKRGGDEHE